MKFQVIVTRDITESTFVDVEACDYESARDKALAEVTSPLGYYGAWEVDDGSCGSGEPYVTGIEEKPE